MFKLDVITIGFFPRAQMSKFKQSGEEVSGALILIKSGHERNILSGRRAVSDR